MKKLVNKKPVNTRLPESVIKRWSIFAAQHAMTKEEALAELIKRGASK